MEIKIENDKENKLMNRREIEFVAEYADKTPSRDEIKNEIVHKLALNADTTFVVKIGQGFGIKSSSVLVYSYPNKESAAKVPEYIKKRHEAKQKNEGEAQAAPEAAPEKEEKKEKGQENETAGKPEEKTEQ